MDIGHVISEVEVALARQLHLVGGDQMVDEAAAALLAAMGPAITRAAQQLAADAAAEVSAQLPDSTVDVVLRGDELALVVSSDTTPLTVKTEDLEARVTVRLPTVLKEQLEDAAGSVGDSVNTYIVKSLSAHGARRKQRRHISGTFDT